MFISKLGRFSFTALIMLVLISGCSVNDSVGKIGCSVGLTPDNNLPKLVLVGTEVVSFDDFKNKSDNFLGHYSVEISDAILSLSITSGSMGYDIERTFQESGEAIHAKNYKSVCISKGIFSAPGLIGKVVNDGILMLEQKSNVDGIPVDLWILYNPYVTH